jgi:3'-phosphoadenosine 5'-phosphosulfate sulfotransferase (PAPS reductase)/FAD synthetase
MQHIVSFSGGKDSTAMVLKMIEHRMKIDRILCVDTTKEFPEMYEHIEKVKEMINPLKIEVIQIDFDYWFGDHIKTKGKNKGKKGYGWADFRNRWCTALKIEALHRTMLRLPYNNRTRLLGKTNYTEITEYHGITADEKARAEKNKQRNITYPLIEWGMTSKDTLKYCYDRGLKWGGLYEKMTRVSCYLCPLSRIGELKIVYSEYPNLWEQMKQLDKKSFRKFRSDYTLQELEDKFTSNLNNEQTNGDKLMGE